MLYEPDSTSGVLFSVRTRCVMRLGSLPGWYSSHVAAYYIHHLRMALCLLALRDISTHSMPDLNNDTLRDMDDYFIHGRCTLTPHLIRFRFDKRKDR